MGLMDFAKKKAGELAGSVADNAKKKASELASDAMSRIDSKLNEGKKEPEPPLMTAFKEAYADVNTHEGEKGFQLYVYDGTPFEGMRVGDEFYLTHKNKTVTLTSIYTGNSETRGAAFYNGRKPIGFTFSDWLNGYLSGFFDARGGKREVLCQLVAWHQMGWPVVRFFLPK